jgi:hypothetical protein
MGVVSTKELARTFEREVGRPAVVKRRIVCVLDDNTTNNAPTTETALLAAALNITETQAVEGPVFGLPHPTATGWKLRKFFINEGYEGSPYHVEVVLEYGTVLSSELVSPLNRGPVVSFEASNAEVPALFYFGGQGMAPLTNSAGDFFPGLTTQEGIVRISIQRNFSGYPSAWLGANNCVNSDAFLGCAQHTLRVSGVSATYKQEVFGGTEVGYFDSTATLLFRQTGHNLLLPDVGFNYIEGAQKRRALVFDFENAQWLPSPNPIALDGSGGLSSGQPEILERRVSPEVSFSWLFPGV